MARPSGPRHRAIFNGSLSPVGEIAPKRHSLPPRKPPRNQWPSSSSMTIPCSAGCSKTWCASSATSRSIAEGGDAAAALLTGADGARIDCVVLDLVMPDLDGLGVLARMREARHRRAGDRADRAWRHRQCGLGDARGRGRFRGQAGRRRAAAGVAAQRARHERARGRTHPHQAQPVRHARLQGHRHPQPGDAGGAAHRREGRGLAPSRC